MGQFDVVHRDEWRRQAEAERALRAREAFQRDPADRQRSFSFTLKEDAQSIPPPAMGTPFARGDVATATSGSGSGDGETFGGGGDGVKGGGGGGVDGQPAGAGRLQPGEQPEGSAVPLSSLEDEFATHALADLPKMTAVGGGGGRGYGKVVEAARQPQREEEASSSGLLADAAAVDDLATHALADLPKMTMALDSSGRRRSGDRAKKK